MRSGRAYLLGVMFLGVLATVSVAGPIHVPSRSVLIPDDMLIPVPDLGVVRYHLMKVLQIPESELFFLPTGKARDEWQRFEDWKNADEAGRARLMAEAERDIMRRAKLYCDERGFLRREYFATALAEHQVDVARMVASIYEFGRTIDRQSAIFDHALPKGIEEDLAGIMRLDSGRSAFAVVNPEDPQHILATVSTAHADRAGKVPLESRLKIDGKPYSLPPVTDEYYLDSSRRPYIYWRNLTRPFPLAEDVFNAYPAVVRKNLRVEIKLYAKDPSQSLPWGVLLARQIIAHNLTRRTNEIVPARFLPSDDDLGLVLRIYERGKRQIDPADYEYQMALRDALFQVIHSQWTRRYVWPEEVVIQEVGDLARRMYSVYFNIKDRYPETPDPDVKGAMATVGRVLRRDFDATLASDQVLKRGDDLIDTFFQRLFQTSPFRDSDCSFMLHAMAVEFPLPGDVRYQTRWFDQKMREMYAKGVFKKSD